MYTILFLLKLTSLDAVQGKREERSRVRRDVGPSSTGAFDEVMRQKGKFCERGSMLIEAVVAISIFMIGFGSVLALNGQALHIVPQISKRLIASELAQEGVEIVRNHITTNAIRGNPFNQGISGGYYSVFSGVSEGPIIDINNPCGNDPGTASCLTQLYLPSSGLGNYTTQSAGGKATPFRRVVYINTGNHEVVVDSIVTWDGSVPSLSGGCRLSQGDCINVEDHLFDWQ